MKWIIKLFKKRPTETPCPKCGSIYSINRYIEDTNKIVRRCSTCDYKWYVNPL